MGYVFISYNSDDEGTANAIRIFLNENGVTTWMTPDSIPGGRTGSFHRSVKFGNML